MSRRIFIALMTLSLSLWVGVSAASVLNEIRVFDLGTTQRYVFDLDEQALIEVDETQLAEGEVRLRLRDTSLGFDLDETPARVRWINTEPSENAPLELVIEFDAPILEATHFVLRSASDLVLNMEFAQPRVVQPVEPTPLIPNLPIVQDPGSLSLAASEEAFTEPLVNTRNALATEGAPEINLPPALLGNQAEGSDPNATVREEVLQGLASIDWERITGREDRVSQSAIGPDAFAETYPGIPLELHVVPVEIADRYRAILEQHRSASTPAVALLRQWIDEHPDSPWNGRLFFLMAEHLFWDAKAKAESEYDDITPHWQGVIDTYRLALRHIPDSPWTAMVHLRFHECYRQMGDMRAALSALEILQAAGTDYSVGTILWMRSEMLRQMGKTDEEIAIHREHILTDPRSPKAIDARLRLGQIYLEREQWLNAYNIYTNAWNSDRERVQSDPETLERIIRACIEMDDLGWALDLINYVFVEYPGRPDNARVAGLLADLHRAQGNLEAEINVVRDILRIYGEQPDTLQSVIRLADLRRSDEASGALRTEITERQYTEDPWDTYQRVIRRFPNSPLSDVARIRQIEMRADQHRAVEAMRLAVNFLENQTDAHVGLREIAQEWVGITLNDALALTIGKQDPFLPLRIYGEALDSGIPFELRPENAWGMAKICREQGLWSQTAAFTADLLRRMDTSHDPMLEILPWDEVLAMNVESQRRLGREDEALAAIDARLASDEVSLASPGLHFERATMLHSMGRWDELQAEVASMEAMNATPRQRVLARFLLADSVRQTEGPDAAVDHYISALEEYQRSGRTHLSTEMPYQAVFQLGDCFYLTGKWALAQRVYDELLAAYPDSVDRPLFQWRRSNCLARLGRVAEAEEELARLREEQPEGIWARLSAETLSDFSMLTDYPDLFSAEGVL